MKKYLTMGGGAALVLAMFLPFTKVYGVTINGLKMGGVAWLYICCGLGAIAMAYYDKKKLYVAGIIVGLFVALLSMKYQADMSVRTKTPVGIGLWVMLMAGVLILVGSILSYRGAAKTNDKAVAN
jgi:hypothetical protein